MSYSTNNMLVLCGMPRSGTTWLAKIIDSHPDIIYRHEPDSEIRMPIPVITTENDDYSVEFNNFVQQLSNHRSAKTCGKLPLFNKSYFSIPAFALFKISIFCAKLAKQLKLNLKVIEYITDRHNELTLFWKSIESSGRIDSILKAIPNARLIYIIRHPYGQIASVLSGENNNRFISKTASSEDYGIYEQLIKTPYAGQNNITLDFIKSLNPVQRMAVRWLLYNEQALSALEHYKSRTFIVNYEELCLQPLPTTKAIFEFAGLSWSKQTEDFIIESVTKHDSSYYGVFKSPQNNEKKKLTDSDKKDIKAIFDAFKPGRCYARYKDNFEN